MIGTEWEDKGNLLGGGKWKISSGGVTPHTLGPTRGNTLELRTADTKGPHLCLVREHLAINFPSTSDGDVAATLRWLGQSAPAGLVAEPTAAWQLAAARIQALGSPEAGLRAGLCADAERPNHVELLLWNVADRKSAVTGIASLVVDGVPLPTVVKWPPKAELGAGNCHLALAPGSTFRQSFALDALMKEHAKDPGKANLAAGPHEIEFVLQVDPTAATPIVLRSKKLQLVTAAKEAAQVDGSAGKDARKR